MPLFWDCLALKMMALCSFEMSVTLYQFKPHQTLVFVSTAPRTSDLANCYLYAYTECDWQLEY